MASRRRWKTLEPIVHRYIQLYLKFISSLYQVISSLYKISEGPEVSAQDKRIKESQGLLGKSGRLYHTLVAKGIHEERREPR